MKGHRAPLNPVRKFLSRRLKEMATICRLSRPAAVRTLNEPEPHGLTPTKGERHPHLLEVQSRPVYSPVNLSTRRQVSATLLFLEQLWRQSRSMGVPKKRTSADSNAQIESSGLDSTHTPVH
jgi:hypothetical protein